MAKQIVLHDNNGNEYTLEFNRAGVERMQRQGFVLDTSRLYMCAKDLIMGAFRMHHRGMTWEKIEPVWKQQTKRELLLSELAQMFSEPVLDLMGLDEEGGASGADENPTWEVLG